MLLVLAAAALAPAACDRPTAIPARDTELVTGVTRGPGEANPQPSLARIASGLGRATLFRFDSRCRVSPHLASSFDISGDGRSWTVQLRDRLTFHDGSTLDAEAVAALIAAEAETDPVARLPGLRDVVGASALDARTVRIDLREPSWLLQEALATMPITGGPDGTSGAGPFIVSGDGRGDTLELSAFPGFYAGRPGIDRIVLRSYATARTAWAALMRGEIDLMHEVSPEAAAFLGTDDNTQVRPFLRSFVYLMGFNLAHPALRSAEVRRAMADSVDRRAIIARVFGGRGVPADDPVWPRHWASDDAAPTDAAARPTARAVRVPPPGQRRLMLRCLVPAGVPLFERLALHVQRAMLDAGVDLRLEPVGLAELSQRLASGDFETYLIEMNGFGLSWTYWLWHSQASGAFLSSGYQAADEALDAVRHARSDEELRARLGLLRRRFRDDPPAVFLCWNEAARAMSARFALPADDGLDIMAHAASWRAVPERR